MAITNITNPSGALDLVYSEVNTPINIKQQGATQGQILAYDFNANSYKPIDTFLNPVSVLKYQLTTATASNVLPIPFPSTPFLSVGDVFGSMNSSTGAFTNTSGFDIYVQITVGVVCPDNNLNAYGYVNGTGGSSRYNQIGAVYAAPITATCTESIILGNGSFYQFAQVDGSPIVFNQGTFISFLAINYYKPTT